MWLIVFFDLPTTEKKDRKASAQFRQFLIRDGYLMIQFSVYGRICKGSDRIEKHYERLHRRLPPKGHVRCLQITDKQYGRTKILVGNKTINEEKATDRLIIIE